MAKSSSVVGRALVRGTGMAVPERVVANDYFASYLETSDEWISERTGISERRWAEPETALSDLGAAACSMAIEDAGLAVDDIDGIICATATPDCIFPSSACLIQNRLGLKSGFAFDLNAACSGFVYAMVQAEAMLRTGGASNILVVGADIFSRIVDRNDRSTTVLFGDGAGALVLSAGPARSEADRGIIASRLCADGAMEGILGVRGGPGAAVPKEGELPERKFLEMSGRDVFKMAVRSLSEVSRQVLEQAGYQIEQVDYIASHQANRRILSAVAQHLKVSMDKVLVNVDRYGNTSAASLPILLAEYSRKGTLKEGDLLLVNAFGGGLTWGAILLRW